MSNVQEQLISPQVIDDAMDYKQYRQLIDNLLEEGKTTGTNHSESMVNYTKMNVHRMNRIDKHIDLSDELVEQLNEVKGKWIWLVLTEAWCGDAAQNVPLIAKMADENDNIEFKLILRDEHPDIMDEYRTDGGRSIPKLICLEKESLEELGSWGPRPNVAQAKALDLKKDPDVGKEEWAEKIHKWYADNRGKEIQDEFSKLISEWSN